MTKWARYRMLGLLYASQLAPLGFFYYALTAVLRRRGVPLQQIGTLQLLALFWVVKCAWGTTAGGCWGCRGSWWRVSPC